MLGVSPNVNDTQHLRHVSTNVKFLQFETVSTIRVAVSLGKDPETITESCNDPSMTLPEHADFIGSGIGEVTTEAWEPPEFLDPVTLSETGVFLVPSRRIEVAGTEKTVYPETVRLLPKLARLTGVDLQFLPTEFKREFLSE